MFNGIKEFKGENYKIIITLDIKERKGKSYLNPNEEITGHVISFTGDIRFKNYSASGQINDIIKQEIFPIANKEHLYDLMLISYIWDEWHLNDTIPGTIKQMKHVKRGKYTTAKKILNEVGLLNDNGYKYGSKWLFNPAPNYIIDLLKRIFDRRIT